MELENSQNNALAKLPMLKLGEYEMWEIRIKQYFQIQDYALWEVIENGNSWVPIPVTALGIQIYGVPQMKILSIIKISVDKQLGYGYLKDIAVRRVKQKEYTFKKADFPRLHLNDIEDIYLLYAQNKLHHLTSVEQTDLVTAIWFFIRRNVTQKRVEDVQLRVMNLNIIMPHVRCASFDNKEPYTIFYEPRGIVYQNKDNNNKFLMRANEVYKFGDGTLKKVRDKLDYMLHNFELGYNEGMPKRAWTNKDKKRITSMLEKIEKMLLTILIMRSLECFVGGIGIEMDYRLLMRTE
ncbi:hypothetical protein Tco_1038046 [Tanacetum coccineum]